MTRADVTRTLMYMEWLAMMPATKWREAAEAIIEAETKALADWHEFVDPLPRRMNVAQRERAAYLRGRLAGLHAAKREFEIRAPIEFYGS